MKAARPTFALLFLISTVPLFAQTIASHRLGGNTGENREWAIPADGNYVYAFWQAGNWGRVFRQVLKPK